MKVRELVMYENEINALRKMTIEHVRVKKQNEDDIFCGNKRSSNERAGEDVNVCTNMASVQTDSKYQ